MSIWWPGSTPCRSIPYHEVLRKSGLLDLNLLSWQSLCNARCNASQRNGLQWIRRNASQCK
eukprot:2204451-Lingulodinium_polyedra.AAC.1